MAEDAMLKEALDAISKGQRSRARDLLTRLLRIDQDNPTYWLWMSSVVESPKEIIYCLENALRLDPQNMTAQRGLILLGAQPAPDNITPAPIPQRKWTIEKEENAKNNEESTKATGMKAVVTNPFLRIILYSFVGIMVIGMIYLVVSGVGSNSRGSSSSVQLTITPKPWTQKPTATLLPTNTPRVKTPTPTFIGPTPLWMLLESTYTPTPIYVNTPHPISEAYRAGLRSFHMGDVDEMLQFMQQAQQIEPESADVHYYIGEAYRLLEDNERALAAYETAISVNPSFAPAYLGRAKIYLKINTEVAVEEDLNQSLSLDPNLVESYLVLSEYYLLINEPESALDTLEHVEDFELNSPLTQLYLAQANLLLDESDAALEFAKQSYDLDQTLLPVYLTLGEIYLQIDQPKPASEFLETYTIHITDNSKAWSLLGESYFKLGQNDKAMEALNISIELDDNNLEAYLFRGYIYIDREEGQSAVNEFFNVRSLVPDSFDACLGMAQALSIAGRLADALRQVNSCQTLILNEGHQAGVFYHRAMIYEEIGNFVSAAEDWQALLDFPPGSISSAWRSTAKIHLADLTPTPISTLTETPAP
ncbi:MAG: tetratricopeptide repeat protein [Anaerolineales bacterium]|nr:tetratricopeptide repeat protein [Anaerolineales bacterium]